jgi:hypothetical protein
MATIDHLSADLVVFDDRYGGNYPDPATVCKGPCEGMGVYPLCSPKRQTGLVRLIAPEPDGLEKEMWEAAHIEAGIHDCDGWHFVKCPACNGTGKKLS